MGSATENFRSMIRIEKPLMQIVIALAAISVSHLAMAERVRGEGGLATELVGVDPASNAAVRETLMLIALGPDKVEPSTLHDRFATCMRNSVVKLVETEDLRSRLDLSVKPWPSMADDIRQAGQPINADTLNAARAARVRQVAAVFADARKRFLSQMAKCGLSTQLAAEARLAVVNLVCVGASLRSCTGNDYLKTPEYSSASRYSKVYEWFQSAGVRIENEFLEIGPDARLTPVAVAYDLYPNRPWPAPRTAEEVQRAFEAGAVAMRSSKAKYSYIAPRVVGLPKETGYRLVDLIASPSLSVPGLPGASPGSPALIPCQTKLLALASLNV